MLLSTDFLKILSDLWKYYTNTCTVPTQSNIPLNHTITMKKLKMLNMLAKYFQ